MRRLTHDEGAVAVVVALLATAILGFAAISVDVAGGWSGKQQVQDGTDAAALAVAQNCAKAWVSGQASCGDAAVTAQTYTTANVGSGTTVQSVSISPAALSPGGGTVTVSAVGSRSNAFATAPTSTLHARSTAAWGLAPSSGPAALPLVFSWCEWQGQTGGGMPSQTTVRVIYFTKSSPVNCYGPSRLAVPGGFGWLDTDSGVCRATLSYNQTATSKTGASVPGTCSPADFRNVINKTLLLPIFDWTSGTGNNASYHIYGFAAFHLVGYNFRSLNYYNGPECQSPTQDCIKGYFTGYVGLSDGFSYSATPPQLGATRVQLTQ